MSVGAGSIKRAAKTVGKKTAAETGSDGKETMAAQAVTDPEATALKETAAKPERKETKAAKGKKTAVTAEEKAAVSAPKAEKGKKKQVSAMKDKTGREETAAVQSATETAGAHEICGIGQQLPTYLL